MALVVPNAGELVLLEKMLKAALATDEGYLLKIYSNDYTPVATSTAANFTEASFTGYSAATFSRSGWGTVTTVDGAASLTYGDAIEWTVGATGQTVYGYYVQAETSGTLLWAEKFAASKALAESDTISITPKFTLSSAN